MYDISERTYEIAKKLNLTIKPSLKVGKKIDVYKNNEFIKSIGAINYNDYHIYLKIDKDLAEKHRKSYIARHKKGILKQDLGEILALKLLWS